MGAEGIIGIRVILDNIHGQVNQQIQNAAFQILDNLRREPPMGTPIDTRWASNNWTVSIDRYRSDQIDPPKPKSKSGRRPQISVENVGGGDLRSFNIQSNWCIYIQNNAPYIKKLAGGYSKQQPDAGWIDGAIDSALAVTGLLRGK